MFRRIRELREQQKLTQKQVAEQLDCSQQIYSNYECGQRHFSVEVLICLAKLYNVSADYILELSDDKTIK